MSIKNRSLTTHPSPFNTPYSLNPDKPKITFKEDSPYTKQSFKEECDINTIMARYIQTGILPDLREVAPQFLDCEGIDFQTSMDFIAGANTLFHELPSSVRAKFGHDTAAFLEFTSNPNNRSEMAQMGLLRADLPDPKGVVAAPPSGASQIASNPQSTPSAENA